MKIRSLAVGLSAAALALTLTSCGSDSSNTDEPTPNASGIETITPGTLTVCSDVPYAPFEDFDESSPSGFKGFDVDIVTAVAEGLDLDLVIKDSSFDALQSGQALNAKQCDIAASAMTITEDRQKNLDFSDGYYETAQSILVPEGSDITSIEDLAGRKVGVQQGTTGKDYAEEHAPDAKIVSFPSDAEMFQAIKAGQVDALLQDLSVNTAHEAGGGFTLIDLESSREVYGLALTKGNTALLEAVNEQLTALRDSGDYQKLYDSYFAN